MSGTWSTRTWGDAGGAQSFTNNLGGTETTDNTYGLPVFHSSIQSQSDWTNSDWRSNGGTILRMHNTTTAGTLLSGGNTICTIDIKVDIIEWGTEDVTMQWVLESVVT